MSAKPAARAGKKAAPAAESGISKKISYRKAGDRFDPVAAAEQSMETLSSQFRGWVEAEIGKMYSAWDAYSAESTPERLEPLNESAHEVKSLGGTLGFPRTGEAAASLVRLFEYIPDPDKLPRALIEQHVLAVRAIFHEISEAGEREEEKKEEANTLVHELVDATNTFILSHTGGKPPEKPPAAA